MILLKMKPVSKKRLEHNSNKPLGCHTYEQLDAKFVKEFLPSNEAQAEVFRFEV